MLLLRIALLGFTGGIIGYITNVLAVKMLFRPINPIQIPILGFELRGLIPKRRVEIATNVANMVDKELLNVDKILENIMKEEDKDKIKIYIKEKIMDILEERGAGFPSFAVSWIKEYISDVLDEELDKIVDDMEDQIVEKAKSRIDIKEIVEDRINSLDLYKLESMIIEVSHKELRHIELLGLILGLIIGVFQGLISIFI